MDDETARLYGYVRVSPHRSKTMMALLKGDKTPTQIGKEVGIRTVHISKVLRDFKDRDMAVCINEEKRKNRIYTLTPLGREVGEFSTRHDYTFK